MEVKEENLTKNKKTVAVFTVLVAMIMSMFLSQTAWSQGFSMRGAAQPESQDGKFTVTIVEPENGTITTNPPIPDDGLVSEGTVISVTATPHDGFALDSCYLAGRTNIEFMTPQIQITIDQNRTIGASFIEKDALEGFTVTHNVVYAQPGVKKLKYDVFSPDEADNLPCIVIIHGGGWSMNTEDVMRGLARELVRSGDYVVFSIDYRWIGTADGDQAPNTMANIIEDVYGAITHIQEHAEEYGADSTRIAVTGDSAGGHLSAAAINMIEMIGDGGFGQSEGIFQYKPTYMPQGKSVEQVREELKAAIQVAAPSYGVFSSNMLTRFAGDGSEESIKAIAPIDNIPNIEERQVPQFLSRGTNDGLITDEAVKSYADALEAAGQRIEYVLVEGAGHAFFDWKPDSRTKATFAQYGVPYAAQMKEFFDSVFYPDR
ncbi:alpha/beta hydrolase fold domain-containing protein [Planctomycetota bacterium]